MTSPAFGYAIVYVSSVRDTIAFYTSAFGLEEGFIHESGDYGELSTGQTKLAFTAHAVAEEFVPFSYRPVAPEGPFLGVEFTLTSPDVDGLFQRAVRAGARALADPHDTPWGQRVAYVADINGFAVGLATPME